MAHTILENAKASNKESKVKEDESGEKTRDSSSLAP
jgi:hypothetical protein